MYFAGTLFTTIGYGDIACETTWGRIITVIYAFLGIPLMLLTLSDLGKFLYVSINETLDWLRDKMYFLHRTKKKKSQITMLDVMSQHDLPIILEEGLANQDLASNNELPLRMSVSSQGEEDKYDSGYNKHNEKVEIFIESPSHASNTLKPTLNNSYSVDTAITIDEAVPEKIGEDEMFECEDDLDFDKPPPRMHVLVALFCTFGWIFFCAAIFILFEEWTYGESLYFFIISFLTIGLGDLSVKRRDMMNLCFIFVIIGLSLVSMCISVIQGAIEDLYKRLIMKLLLDYTAKMAQGGDYKNASMGLMQAWGSNKAAKYLMPLISAEKRKTVMATIQEEARESGIEMPAILNDIDEKSGMPKIFTIQNEEPEICEMLFENLCRENDPQRTETMSRSMMIPILSFEVHCQTDPKDLSDTDMQTEAKDLSDSDVQTDTTDVSETEVQTDTTDISETEVQTNILVLEESTMQTDEEIKDLADEFTQYDSVETFDEDIQTDRQELFDNETMTTIIEYEENGLQTESVSLSEKEIQTLTPTLHVNEVQTEPTPTEENGVQTLDRETNDLEMQTEPPDMTKFLKKICKPRRKIKRRKTFSFLQRKASLPLITPEEPTIIEATPSESTESDEDVKDESSAEKLNWDPIDGMHAEKQRPVKDLLKMFNKSAKNTANQSLSRRKSK
uniref:Ion_trans_2 domain-containing protein n=1 Tax=Rhabditophanes sp. KR3021 TaxID=114890 RepID=A0AC35U4Z1_9BILA